MNWITIVWPMIAAACLTLAAMHVLVWIRSGQSWANLAFSILAVCVAAIAAFELALMRALVVGGSLTVFILMAGSLVVLVHRQMIAAPYLVSLPFMILVVAMGFESSHDELRAAHLAREMREHPDALNNP